MIRISTPSKINLSLNVLSARTDGYHEIDSIFYPLSVPSDNIGLDFPSDRTEGILIRSADPEVPLDPERNLCGRAVSAFCRAAGIAIPAVDIFLEKQIPYLIYNPIYLLIKFFCKFYIWIFLYFLLLY